MSKSNQPRYLSFAASLWATRGQRTSLLQITAATEFLDGSRRIQPGDTVLYYAVRPDENLSGKVICVSDGTQIQFGRAEVVADGVMVKGKKYPRHMVRGKIWSVARPISQSEPEKSGVQ